ncbi:MAG: hypothetical protein KBA53_12940 [Thermoclostridium sp.]|nr:hypothetical protein [Thermoclostridium sp.]
MMTESRLFKRGFTLILADVLALLVGILNGFFLPKVFSIDGYAFFRTFTLYATYAVVFSFGLTDGMYLLYGGKEEKQTDPALTKAYYFFLLKMQALILLILLLLSHFILKDDAFLYFSLFVLPLQSIHFFRLYYRALGEFKKYSVLQIGLVFFELLNTLLIVFYIRSEQPYLFIILKIINHTLIAIILTAVFLLKYKSESTVSLKREDALRLIKPGFVVMLADLLVAFVFSLDRWFVKLLFSQKDFAFYAFAVSILTLFVTLITSVANIFYSGIARKYEDSSYLNSLRSFAVVSSSFLPLSYFVLQAIIQWFLPAYSSALQILQVLVLMLPFAGVVLIVTNNLYKANRDVKRYITRMITILVISFLLNLGAFLIWRTMLSIAAATLLAYVLWYVISFRDFPSSKKRVREVLYLSFSLSTYVLVQYTGLNWLVSFGLCLCILGLTAFAFYRKEISLWMKVNGNSLEQEEK